LKRYAILLVVLGAALWGTDSLFRRPLSSELSPVTIVLLEHCLLSVLMLPFLLGPGSRSQALRRTDIVSLLFIAIGGSVAATSLFTYGIKYGNPSVVVVLQKTQPLFAIFLARLFLGERSGRRFWFCLAPALVGAILISVPDWRAGLSSGERGLSSILAALGAAFLWGASTVFGRYTLGRLPVLRLTAMRFLLALPVLVVAYFLQPQSSRSLPNSAGAAGLLVSMALFSSLAGLLLYYRGLQFTRASVAAVAEMAFPLTAVAANWLVLGVRLSASQVFGAAVLVLSITGLTYLDASREKPGVAGAGLDNLSTTPASPGSF